MTNRFQKKSFTFCLRFIQVSLLLAACLHVGAQRASCQIGYPAHRGIKKVKNKDYFFESSKKLTLMCIILNKFCNYIL